VRIGDGLGALRSVQSHQRAAPLRRLWVMAIAAGIHRSDEIE
jgi:hypothetical protein